MLFISRVWGEQVGGGGGVGGGGKEVLTEKLGGVSGEFLETLILFQSNSRPECTNHTKMAEIDTLFLT